MLIVSSRLTTRAALARMRRTVVDPDWQMKQLLSNDCRAQAAAAPVGQWRACSMTASHAQAVGHSSQDDAGRIIFCLRTCACLVQVGGTTPRCATCLTATALSAGCGARAAGRGATSATCRARPTRLTRHKVCQACWTMSSDSGFGLVQMWSGCRVAANQCCQLLGIQGTRYHHRPRVVASLASA